MNTDPAIDDLELLRRGDSKTLGELFDKYRSQLARLIRFRMDRRIQQRVDVADVLQETFLDVRKRIDSYLNSPDTTFFVWLRGIACNTLHDIHRNHLGAQKRSANKELPFGDGVGSETSVLIVAHLIGEFTSPSEAAMRDESSRILREALSRMEELDQEVLALRHFEQLSNKQVSEVLEITKTTASGRYMRALQRLQETLEQIPGFLDGCQ